MTTDNLFTLILFIAPGFISLEIYRWYYPGKERNNFFHSTLSIIIGTAIYLFIQWLNLNLLNNILIIDRNTNNLPNIWHFIALCLTAVFLGIFLICIYKLRILLSNKFPKLSFIGPDPKSIWAKINDKSNTDWAVVYINDGSIYLGWISIYKFDPNDDDQDFLLTDAKRVDENLEIRYNVTGKGVYLNTKNILRIEFLKGKNKE